jgi:hypothetical protein
MTVINKQKEYIFVHIPKSAGKSIKEHLIKNTFSSHEQRLLKLNFVLEALGSYASAIPPVRKVVPPLHGLGTDIRVRDYCSKNRIYTTAHLRADQIYEILGAEEYNSMFSFAFVRNPWDRCLSAYFYFRRKTFHPLHRLAMSLSYEDFLLEQEQNGMPYIGQQVQWIYRNGQEKMIDFVGKVENIDSDMLLVDQRLGLTDSVFSSRANVSPARDRDYRIYYTDKSREIVERSMQPDIELLHYSF